MAVFKKYRKYTLKNKNGKITVSSNVVIPTEDRQVSQKIFNQYQEGIFVQGEIDEK